ncbi:MAG: hypothetical protein J2P38_10360, partial [Candidatus Dormibacteraeota bacterium]|nr:hypothetical protein [Candidatus Dormibacteraeota bacterium]
MNSSPHGSWPPPQGGWTPRPPEPDPNTWPGTTPTGSGYPPPQASGEDPISTTGATVSLALGIAAFVVALLSMTIGTVLVVSISIPSSLYLVFMLISAAG